MTNLGTPWSAALRDRPMAFATALGLGPIAIVLAASLKDGSFRIVSDLASWRAFGAPDPTGESDLNVLAGAAVPFGRALLNTAIIVAGIVGGGVLVDSACAYGLARVGLPGRTAMLAAIVALVILPLEAIAVPLLQLVNRMGITDTDVVQIIPFVARPFSIFPSTSSCSRSPATSTRRPSWTAPRRSAPGARSSCRSRGRRSPRWRSSRGSSNGTAARGRRWSPAPTT